MLLFVMHTGNGLNANTHTNNVPKVSSHNHFSTPYSHTEYAIIRRTYSHLCTMYIVCTYVYGIFYCKLHMYKYSQRITHVSSHTYVGTVCYWENKNQLTRRSKTENSIEN